MQYRSIHISRLALYRVDKLPMHYSSYTHFKISAIPRWQISYAIPQYTHFKISALPRWQIAYAIPQYIHFMINAKGNHKHTNPIHHIGLAGWVLWRKEEDTRHKPCKPINWRHRTQRPQATKNRQRGKTDSEQTDSEQKQTPGFKWYLTVLKQNKFV